MSKFYRNIFLILQFTLIATACAVKTENSVNVSINGENVIDSKTTSDTDNQDLYSFNLNNSELKKINFGHQNDKDVFWFIIYENDENGTYVLLSEKVLDVAPYNEKNVDIKWGDTTLHEYLNTDFLNEYFSKEELNRLVFTNDEDGDYVTMLSINNILDFFGDTNYAIDGYYNDEDYFCPNAKIIAGAADNAIYNDIDQFDNEVFAEYLRTTVDERYNFANGAVPYWLLNQNEYGNPFYVTSTGYIDYIDDKDQGYIGFRPVIVIKK